MLGSIVEPFQDTDSHCLSQSNFHRALPSSTALHGTCFRVAEVDICSSLDLLLKVSCFNLVCPPKCGLHWWSRRCFLEIISTKNVGSFTKGQSLLTCVEHLVTPRVASGWVRGSLDGCRFLSQNPLPCPASDVGSGQLVFGMLVMELVALCHSCQKSCTWSGMASTLSP